MLSVQNISVNYNAYINSKENTICRLCLHKFAPAELEDVFKEFQKSDQGTIAEYVTKLVDIPISKEDCFSKSVCKGCVKKLTEIEDFKKNIVACNEFLKGLEKSYNQQKRLPNLNISKPVLILFVPAQTKNATTANNNNNNNKSDTVTIKTETTDGTVAEPSLNSNDVEKDDSKIDVIEHSLEVPPAKVETEPKLAFIVPGISFVNNTVAASLQPAPKKKRIRRRNPNLRYPCKYCEKIYKTKSARDAHLNEHTGKYYRCDHCEKKFKSKHTFAQHKKIHVEGNPLKCPECGRQCATKASLQDHLEAHKGISNYICEECGKCFRHPRTFYSHKRDHYKQHTERICKICNKKLWSRSSHAMKAHMQRHLQDREQQCPKCPRVFTTKQGYLAHLRKHNGELEFKCDECPKAYATKSSLRNHKESIHCTAKPFSCEFCGKAFALKTGWYLHGRVHAKENPFKCTVCEKIFGYPSHLKGHMKVVHGILDK